MRLFLDLVGVFKFLLCLLRGSLFLGVLVHCKGCLEGEGKAHYKGNLTEKASAPRTSSIFLASLVVMRMGLSCCCLISSGLWFLDVGFSWLSRLVWIDVTSNLVLGGLRHLLVSWLKEL